MGNNVLVRAGLVLLCVASLSPQTFSQTQASGASQPAGKSQLALDVVVTDRSGKAVSGLEEKDFSVFDNKHPQNILSFRAEPFGTAASNLQTSNSPVKIILLVDEVNTNFRRVAYERSEIKKFLQQKEGVLAHPMSLAFFSDTTAEIQDNPSHDGNALLAEFDQHETALRSIRRDQGFYGAVERFQLSLKTLEVLVTKEAQTPGRKVVIWISPGWPILSGPEIELSNKQREDLFRSIVSISTALRQARVTLYNINPQGAEDAGGVQSYYYKNFLKPMTSPKNVLPGNLALQVITEQSGGLVFTAGNDITGQINRCVADVDAFYTLTLEPAAAEQPNEYHALELKVAAQGLTVRTRDGYYAQP